ncbi:hypothetical protein FGO68_gene17063 [Halteria grandinella]|uniref:TRP C-terminal domain-containing protein n=1 Tax=Halteria grandinella TaxID=5974 RepID=A0A8J8P5C5_HALGN|nr:hypothetical protein FGO68_gene17063 [Halteria grandinella]
MLLGVIVCLREYTGVQLVVINLGQVLIIVALEYFRPVKEGRGLVLFNEVMIQVYLLVLITLTDINPEAKLREQLGISMLFIITFTTLINVSWALFQIILQLKQKLRLKSLARTRKAKVYQRDKQQIPPAQKDPLQQQDETKNEDVFIPVKQIIPNTKAHRKRSRIMGQQVVKEERKEKEKEDDEIGQMIDAMKGMK